jgi:hypothetical protein
MCRKFLILLYGNLIHLPFASSHFRSNILIGPLPFAHPRCVFCKGNQLTADTCYSQFICILYGSLNEVDKPRLFSFSVEESKCVFLLLLV